MSLYDPAAPKSTEAATKYVVLGILSNCPSVQELLEATDASTAAAKIKVIQDLPKDGETYTRDELESMGMWSTLMPPVEGASLTATPSGASGIRDVTGQLSFHIHRMVRDSEMQAPGGREDVFSFVCDRSAAIVEEFSALADPIYNDGGLLPLVFTRDGIPVFNPKRYWADQGIFMKVWFMLHWGRSAE